ncbi:MAG: ATP-binding protein [Thiobacillus sp.]|nr:ATP-binding protein [Thiobacillus sp.]
MVNQAEASSEVKSLLKNSARPLLWGLAGMLLLMCAGMGIGIYQLQHMATTLDNVVQEDEAARKAINTMMSVTRERNLIMTEVLGIADPFERDERLLVFDRIAKSFSNALKQQALLSVTPSERTVLAKQKLLTMELVEQFERVANLTRKDELIAAENLFRSTVIPKQSEMLDLLKHWSEVHYERHGLLVNEVQAQQRDVINMMFGVAVISILVGILVATAVYRWNSRLMGRFVSNEINLRDALAQSAFRQKALDTHSIVSVTSADGSIIHANDKFCEVSGYLRDELIGRNHRVIKSDWHSAAFFQGLWDTICAGKIWTGEVRNRAKNGQHHWVQTTIVPMLDENGLPVRYVSLGTDITQVKEMEASVREANSLLKSKVLERTEELEKAKTSLEHELGDRVRTQDALQKSYDELKSLHQQLQEAQQYLMQSEKMAAVGQLAAGMAHEINNPIGFIASNLTTLGRYQDTLGRVLERYILQEQDMTEDTRAAMVAFRQQADLEFLLKDTQDLLAESRSGVERVRNIVQDLRDFARVDRDVPHQYADINQSLDAMLNLLGKEFEEGVSIQRAYEGQVQVECNPAELNQVFINLLNNARQALQDKQGSIILRSGVENSLAWVEIEDTGEGIAETVLPRIFDPFFTTRPISQGAGLGLSTAYGVVQQHGGKITVSSQVGVGTVFKVSLPVRQVTAVENKVSELEMHTMMSHN